MRLLALDLATALGYAVGDIDARPTFGTHVLPSTGPDVGRFLSAYDDWLRAVIALHSPERIVFEAPILWAGRTSRDTARKLMGLGCHTEFICHRARLRCQEGNLAAVKKHMTGHGRADKATMIAAARQRGYAVGSEHEADAIGLWIYAAHCIRPDRPISADPLMGAT